jgi:hypothetical protein
MLGSDGDVRGLSPSAERSVGTVSRRRKRWRVPLVSVNVGQRLPDIRKQSVERFERSEQPGRRNAPPTDRYRASRPAPSPARTKTRTICLHERARRSDVGRCLSPDGYAAGADRQDAVRNPSPHVAAFNWVQAGQSGRGYSVAATLPRPQEHPAYGSI